MTLFVIVLNSQIPFSVPNQRIPLVISSKACDVISIFLWKSLIGDFKIG